MKREYIKWLIGTIALALLALIFIQLYWVRSAVKLREEAFFSDVHEALAEVVLRLEEEETVLRLKSHQKGRYLFLGDDPLKAFSGESKSDYMLFQQINKDDSSVEIQLIEEQKGQERVVSTTRPLNNDETSDSLGSLIKRELEFNKSFFTEKGQKIESANIDSLLSDKFESKRAFVGDIVKSLMEVDINQPIEDRIKLEHLQQIIREELENTGIKTSFDFAVCDAGSHIHLLSDSLNAQNIKDSDFRVRIFPHDLLSEAFYLSIFFPDQQSYILKASVWMLASSALIVLAIMLIFIFSVNTIINQKRNSEIKNDFINNMTHELKTPISTISLACEALKDPDMNKNSTMVSRYVNMIGEENTRLGLLVEDVLQSAVLDKSEFKLKQEAISVHAVLEKVLDKQLMKIREQKGSLDYEPLADMDLILGDRVHLGNVFNNLIDNAIKYSKEAPRIAVRTHYQDKEISISVQDNGIGIPKEHQKRIFDKLYRVPTGNLHDVKGFGLGLSYVKIIVEKLSGNVSLNSEPGKGSIFTIKIPVYENV